MSKNTVKPALTPKPRKRAKRQVENSQFDAFVRRILRAYARRVAAGDVEALATLAALASEVDAVCRLAVAGLRRAPYWYSWQEIADRLGITRQAAQMRYGDRTDRGALDRRLLDAGLRVSVATLVQVFADHHPGSPAATRVSGLRLPLPRRGPRLPHQRHRASAAAQAAWGRPGRGRPTHPDQFADLHHRVTSRLRAAVRQAALTPCPDRHPSLFDLAGKDTDQ